MELKSAITSRAWRHGPFEGPSSYPQLVVVADCETNLETSFCRPLNGKGKKYYFLCELSASAVKIIIISLAVFRSAAGLMSDTRT